MEKKKFKILIADDSKIVRSMVIASLEKLDIFTIDEAVDGKEASEKLNVLPYNIVLMDWNMPEMSGGEVVDEVRTGSGPNKETPVIMITGESSKKRVLEIARMGVSGYVVKPFETDDLAKKIINILKNR
jgi:two-component system chemotaxis response regulator CheY